MTQTDSGIDRPAELLPRFLAKLVDFVLLGVVNFVLVSSFLIGVLFGGSGATAFGMMGEFGPAGIVSAVVSALLYVAYFSLMESSLGQTLGKMLLGLRVEGRGGGKPGLEAAVRRNAWMLLAVMPWLGGVAQFVAAIAIAVTINSSPTNTGWHDDVGGTRVVKTA